MGTSFTIGYETIELTRKNHRFTDFFLLNGKALILDVLLTYYVFMSQKCNGLASVSSGGGENGRILINNDSMIVMIG